MGMTDFVELRGNIQTKPTLYNYDTLQQIIMIKVAYSSSVSYNKNIRKRTMFMVNQYIRIAVL